MHAADGDTNLLRKTLDLFHLETGETSSVNRNFERNTVYYKVIININNLHSATIISMMNDN